VDTEVSEKSIRRTLSRSIKEDHIRRVDGSEPKVSPSDIMQIIMSLASREFFKHYAEIKKQYFWSGKLRTQRYFVVTIGNVNEETIRAYVQNQLKVMDQLESASKQIKPF
jgi:putative transposase